MTEAKAKKEVDINKIIERIRKLLAMAGDKSSEREAAIAASRAAKLMAEYNVAMADVIANDLRNDGNVVNETMTDMTYARAYPVWINSLSIIVARLFDCEVRLTNKYWAKDDVNHVQLSIFGYKSDVEVAKYVFIFLLTTAQRMAQNAWDKKSDRYKSQVSGHVSWKRQYCLGIVDGIEGRLHELYKKPEVVASSGTSLVVMKKEIIEKKFGVFEYTQTHYETNHGYGDGVKDADSIALSKGMEGSSNERIDN